MTEIDVCGLKFAISTENGFIKATNDSLNISYVVRYGLEVIIESAHFVDKTCEYLCLNCFKNNKRFGLYLTSSVIHDSHNENYDLRFNFMRKNMEPQTQIAKLALKINRMKIEHYYYLLNINRQLEMLAKLNV
jgi:hypothetical protein